MSIEVYAAQPREGTETGATGRNRRNPLTRFMQLNPARGRKLIRNRNLGILQSPSWFMQLNPARGRKLDNGIVCVLFHFLGLCSSTPRGDGNLQHPFLVVFTIFFQRFMQLNPARGRKLKLISARTLPHHITGLCSSTPRGDGNFGLFDEGVIRFHVWFMQLNPARGRKPKAIGYAWGCIKRGLCSSTPRGDGNSVGKHRVP